MKTWHFDLTITDPKTGEAFIYEADVTCSESDADVILDMVLKEAEFSGLVVTGGYSEAHNG